MKAADLARRCGFDRAGAQALSIQRWRREIATPPPTRVILELTSRRREPTYDSVFRGGPRRTAYTNTLVRAVLSPGNTGCAIYRRDLRATPLIVEACNGAVLPVGWEAGSADRPLLRLSRPACRPSESRAGDASHRPDRLCRQLPLLGPGLAENDTTILSERTGLPRLGCLRRGAMAKGVGGDGVRFRCVRRRIGARSARFTLTAAWLSPPTTSTWRVTPRPYGLTGSGSTRAINTPTEHSVFVHFSGRDASGVPVSASGPRARLSCSETRRCGVRMGWQDTGTAGAYRATSGSDLCLHGSDSARETAYRSQSVARDLLTGAQRREERASFPRSN